MVGFRTAIFIFFNFVPISGRLACYDDECEFELILRHRFTMSCLADNGRWYPIQVTQNGESFEISATTNGYYTDIEYLRGLNLTFQEENCIFGDGTKTSIITINDQFPGPTIEVRKGAKVHIKAVNYLQRYIYKYKLYNTICIIYTAAPKRGKHHISFLVKHFVLVLQE